jgi:hypothetical protein
MEPHNINFDLKWHEICRYCCNDRLEHLGALTFWSPNGQYRYCFGFTSQRTDAVFTIKISDLIMFMISRQSAHEGGKVISPMRWPSLTPPPAPQKVILVLISVKGWVHFWAIMRSQGLSQWKIPVIPPGVRLVPQCLNQMRHPVPLVMTGGTRNCNWSLRGVVSHILLPSLPLKT